MAFVAAATSVGAAVLGTGAAAGIGSTLLGGALIGAGIGGAYSAITGDGDILNSMLTGGLLGAGGAGLGSAMGLGAAKGAGSAALTPGAAASLPSTAAVPTANVATVTPAMQAAALESAAVAEGATTAGMVGAANTGLPANTVLPASMNFTPPAAQTAAGLTGKEKLGYGLAGTAALSLLGSNRQKNLTSVAPDPGQIRPYTYSQTINPNYGMPGEPYYIQSYEAQPPYAAKAGGLMKLAYGGPVESMSAKDRQPGMYPQGMITSPKYATPSQMPSSMEVLKSDYDTPVNPITGLQDIGMARGGMVAFANGGMPISSVNTTTDEDMRRTSVAQVPVADAIAQMMSRAPQASQAVSPNATAQGLPPMQPPPRTQQMPFMPSQQTPAMAQSMYGQSTPTATGVDVLGLAPNLGQYGRTRRQNDPSVADYNQLLAERATNEYLVQPPPVSTLPGGGERATLGDTKKLINEYYLSELGRQADPEGLDFWAKSKIASGQSLADIRKHINDSPEGRVFDIYRDVLGRRPDEGGGAYWTQAIASGADPAKIRQEIERSPEALAKNPEYKAYLEAPITEANFDAAAYLAANPDVARPGAWAGTPYQHYVYATSKGENRVATKKPFQPTAADPTRTGGTGGYTYDRATGRYNRTAPAQVSSALPDLSSLGIDINDPGFANFLQNQYNQYQQSQYGGGGGKAGGLMPGALRYAAGGMSNLGGYSDGGRMLKGPGDGMSDDIPGVIGGRQPARLADGEFVVPADVVSHLGNGSTDAGAKRLYSMMDRVRKARTGTKKQGKQIKAEKYLPV